MSVVNAQLTKALVRLKALLAAPEHTSVDGHPQVRLSNGKAYEVQEMRGRPGYYIVGRDHGLTCEDVAYNVPLETVALILLEEGK